MTDHPRTAPVTAPPTQRKMWIGGLEGPRGIAGICVVVVHVAVVFTPPVADDFRLDYLGQGLTFFFVLSGFLLYLPFVTRAADGRPRPSTATYFVSRLRRVFPAYLGIFCLVNFVLGAAYVVNPVLTGWDRVDAGTGTITDPWHLLAHLTLTQTFFPATLQTGINPAWSLTTEWTFYMVLPVVGWLLFRSRFTRRLTSAMVPAGVLILVGFVGNAVIGVLQGGSGLSQLERNWGPNGYAVLARSFLAFADTFAWGMVAAVVYTAITRGAVAQMSTMRLQAIFGTICVTAVAASMVVFLMEPRWTSSAFAIGAACFILTIVTPLGRGERSPLAEVADWRPIRYLGMISLSSYLWHYPVIILVDRVGIPIPPTPFGLLWGTVVVLAVTFTLATITFYVIERPAMRWRA